MARIVGSELDCVPDLKAALDVTGGVYAVEKNAHAVCTLRGRKRHDPAWRDVVVVPGDMRRVAGGFDRVDCLVSELLGSFGDNELSPECLDGAAAALLKPGGASIPRRYVSYAQPVACAKLWFDARREHGRQRPPGRQRVRRRAAAGPGPRDALRRAAPQLRALAAHARCFAFDHPGDAGATNDRDVDLAWDIAVDATVHGLAGTFHADLYGDVSISIYPPTFSEGMFSWFPLFLPSRRPRRPRRHARRVTLAPVGPRPRVVRPARAPPLAPDDGRFQKPRVRL
ncbi:hypothetical protein JL722_10179 [Aureococcus anophagefferens]|nr:hypothetical protein JL722_10179 [Aureococcus anophagefferens]